MFNMSIAALGVVLFIMVLLVLVLAFLTLNGVYIR